MSCRIESSSCPFNKLSASLEKTNKRPLALKYSLHLWEFCASFYTSVTTVYLPLPSGVYSPCLFFPLLSAAKVNGDERAHQRLDVVAGEQ